LYELVHGAAASATQVASLQAEVNTLAVAAREVARFQNDETQAERTGRKQDQVATEAQLAAVHSEFALQVQAMQRQHEAALADALAKKDAMFARERDAIRRSAARERSELVRAKEQSEGRLAEVQAAYHAEHVARGREAAGCDAACQAEDIAMARVVELEVELDDARSQHAPSRRPPTYSHHTPTRQPSTLSELTPSLRISEVGPRKSVAKPAAEVQGEARLEADLDVPAPAEVSHSVPLSGGPSGWSSAMVSALQGLFSTGAKSPG